MKEPTVEQRAEELRRSIAERQRQLTVAVETLSSVSGDYLTVGHHVAEHPWHWLAGACVAGLIVGLNRTRD